MKIDAYNSASLGGVYRVLLVGKNVIDKSIIP
jgi:hypothetical protein